MESSSRVGVLALLVISSAVSSLLFITGIRISASELLPYAMYFPFYAIFGVSSLAMRVGVYLPLPYVFLAGVILSAGCLFFLIRKMPPSMSYVGISVLFFTYLVVVGQKVFVKIIFLPQASSVTTVLTSLRVVLEFFCGLAVIYVLLGTTDFSTVSLRENLFKKGSRKER
ncbi:MAG: hypothetical protein HXS52_04575 [Theionarchaea archaeon]|nr:hypothetical protein [Theionarchaea archaeon]MBU7037182.1 hypothetical protein [Theionarchaea archaeon]